MLQLIERFYVALDRVVNQTLEIESSSVLHMLTHFRQNTPVSFVKLSPRCFRIPEAIRKNRPRHRLHFLLTAVPETLIQFCLKLEIFVAFLATKIDRDGQWNDVVLLGSKCLTHCALPSFP